MTVVSSGCVLWLDAARPFFAALAAVALLYQGWLIWRRPPSQRTGAMLTMFWASAAISASVVFVVGALAWRYR